MLHSENKLKVSRKHFFDASYTKQTRPPHLFMIWYVLFQSWSAMLGLTAFHKMIAALASGRRVMRLDTQNADGTDTYLPPLLTSVPLRMNFPWSWTIQLHRGLEVKPLSDLRASLFEGPLAACLETDKMRTDHDTGIAYTSALTQKQLRRQ